MPNHWAIFGLSLIHIQMCIRDSCGPVREILGEDFCQIFAAIKESELDNFEGVVSAWEREHLLLKVQENILTNKGYTADIADKDDAAKFLADNPDIAFIDVIYTPITDVPRGKRIRPHELLGVYGHGRYLPGSITVVDTCLLYTSRCV